MSWSYVLGIGGGFVLLAFSALFMYQEKLLYFPTVPGVPKLPEDNPRGFKSPNEHRIRFEDVFFKTSDNVALHSWLMLQDRPRECPTLIYFHGNAGNIGFRLPNATDMFKKVRCNILMVDYRGYGNSEGVPSEKGLGLDGNAAVDTLLERDDIDSSKIILFGRSLGGAVSLAVGMERSEHVLAIILENTFLNIEKMVDVVMPTLSPIKGLVLRMDWPNQERVQHWQKPILFLSGKRDELVPPFHMRQLFELCKSEHKELYEVEEGTHNDTWQHGGDSYIQVLKMFIDGAVTSVKTEEPTIDSNESPFEKEHAQL